MSLLSRRKSSPSSSEPKSNNRSYTPRFKVYRDKEGQFRWSLVGSNGKIMADSGEGYVTRHNCRQAIRRFIAAAEAADVVESAEEL